MVKEFLLGLSQAIRVNKQQTEEFRVISGLPQGSVLCSLLFVAYVNVILGIIGSNMRQFADDCIIYRKITDSRDIQGVSKRALQL